MYQEAYKAQDRGDHATFNSRYLELQALLAQLALLPARGRAHRDAHLRHDEALVDDLGEAVDLIGGGL